MTVAHARWIVRRTQAAACGALVCLVGCEREPAVQSAAPSAPALAEQLAAGAQLYEMNCAQCHFAGEGSPTAPPLTGSAAVLSDAGVIRIILEGQRNQSVVNGQKFNGIMPAMEYLSDEEIAAVSAYLRNRYGGSSKPISPAEVANARGSLSSR